MVEIESIIEWHTLDCFKPRSYPAPVESVAKDHSLYVDGTKLINGKPFLSYGKTDASRIEEFQKLGFSRDYIRALTDGAFNKYYECSKGKKCNYGSSLPYKPSYAKIGALTELYCDDVKQIVEIKNNEVFFNGALIASAPLTHNNGKKFTSAQRASFCKAVIFSIIPGEIKRPIKDHPSKCTVYEAVPDDEYLRELIAKYPALIEVQSPELQQIMRDEHPERYEAQKEADDLVLPDHLSAYTHEAITGFPDGGIFKYTPDYEASEYDTLLINGMFEHGPSMLDPEYDMAFLDETEKEIIGDMWSGILQEKAIVQKFSHPWLRCNIVEVCTA